MYCKKCGNQLADGAAFCTACGEKTVAIPENQPTPAEPPTVSAESTTQPDSQPPQSAEQPEQPAASVESTPQTAGQPAQSDGQLPQPDGQVVGSADGQTAGSTAQPLGTDSPAPPYPTPQPDGFDAAPVRPDNSGKKKIAVIAVAIVVVIGLAAFMIYQSGQRKAMAEFHDAFAQNWYDTHESIIKELVITEDQIEYNVITSFSFLDSTIATNTYEVVAPGKIRHFVSGNGYEVEIEFSNDGKVMTCRPALTSLDSIESWYRID